MTGSTFERDVPAAAGSASPPGATTTPITPLWNSLLKNWWRLSSTWPSAFSPFLAAVLLYLSLVCLDNYHRDTYKAIFCILFQRHGRAVSHLYRSTPPQKRTHTCDRRIHTPSGFMPIPSTARIVTDHLLSHTIFPHFHRSHIHCHPILYIASLLDSSLVRHWFWEYIVLTWGTCRC